MFGYAFDGYGGDVVGAVGKTSETDSEIHDIFGVVHPGGNGDGLELFLGLVDGEGHGVAGLVVIVNDEFGDAVACGVEGNVALGVGGLNVIFVWRNVVLGEFFHLVRVILVFFLFLFDDVLLEPTTATAGLFLRRGGGLVERSFYGLAIGALANFEVFGFLLFPLENDLDSFFPGVLRESLFVLGLGFFEFGDAGLQIGGALGAKSRRGERGGEGEEESPRQ